MQTQALPTSKIILLIAFVCAALITTLFLFNLRHKPTSHSPASDDSLIFPVPRDIMPFELAASNNKKFTRDDFFNHWTLLFFGFTHCAYICPTTMATINSVYPELHRNYPNLQVVLISLDPERDTPEAVDKFVHSFNPNFKGVTGSLPEIRKLQSQLGIFSARQESEGGNYQIQHTSSILLINPQGKWAGLFKFGTKPAQFARSFDDNIKALMLNTHES